MSQAMNDPRDEIIKNLTSALTLMAQITKPKNEITETESRTGSIWECCPICMEEDIPAGRVITRCGHSVCLPCYVEISRDAVEGSRCPMCREELPDAFAPLRPQPQPLRLRRAGEIVVDEPTPVATPLSTEPQEQNRIRNLISDVVTRFYPHASTEETNETVEASFRLAYSTEPEPTESEPTEPEPTPEPEPAPAPEPEPEPAPAPDPLRPKFYMIRRVGDANDTSYAQCSICRWYGPSIKSGGFASNPNCVTRRRMEHYPNQRENRVVCGPCSLPEEVWQRKWTQEISSDRSRIWYMYKQFDE